MALQKLSSLPKGQNCIRNHCVRPILKQRLPVSKFLRNSAGNQSEAVRQMGEGAARASGANVLAGKFGGLALAQVAAEVRLGGHFDKVIRASDFANSNSSRNSLHPLDVLLYTYFRLQAIEVSGNCFCVN